MESISLVAWSPMRQAPLLESFLERMLSQLLSRVSRVSHLLGPVRDQSRNVVAPVMCTARSPHGPIRGLTRVLLVQLRLCRVMVQSGAQRVRQLWSPVRHQSRNMVASVM